MKNTSKLIGKRVYITDKDSIYCGEWGIIAHYDGECYHIKIANGADSMPVFDRDQFRVPRTGGKGIETFGKWAMVSDDDQDEGRFLCSVCGYEVFMFGGTPKENGMNFCPHCGKMMA